LNEKSESQNPNNIAAAVVASLVCIVCLFSNLGAIGLVGPDEPRFVWIARAMATTSDWVTPRLYGTPWFEKPILYYWAAAIGFRLHFSAEWAARLPSALAALSASSAVAWLGWKHYGARNGLTRSPALLAPIIFSTSVAAIAFARAATPDMLFAAAITLAMASASEVLRRTSALRAQETVSASDRNPDFVTVSLFGVFLGFSVLAKGPAGVILAGGAVGLWALLTQKWHQALRLVHPAAVAAFCFIAVPWYLICALRNPEFINVFIFQHNFERYLTPVFQHKQPFSFFGPITILALLPWSAFLAGSLWEGVRLWREKTWLSSPGFFFCCWAVFPVMFFSLSQSKLPSYILPAIPALALVASVGGIRAFERRGKLAIAIAAGTAFVWTALAIYLLHAVRGAPVNSALHVSEYSFAAILLAAAVIATALIVAGYRRGLPLAIAICCLAVVATLGAANIMLLPELDPAISARPYAELLQNDLHPDRIFEFRVKRSWNYGLAFYFRRELPEWSPEDREAALVLTTREGFQKIVQEGRFHGNLEQEPQGGLLYVPIEPAPR
jgi:4-amino-4-deoxy-L-arabinose transferase-like glycosyltransferase